MLLYGTQDRLTDEDLDISAGSFDKLVSDPQVCHFNPVPRLAFTFMVVVKNSLGKISFTCDRWTSDINRLPRGPGFLTITAHWCAEEPTLGLAIRSALVAIEYMLPDEWWRDIFKRVFKRLSLSPKKVGHSD